MLAVRSDTSAISMTVGNTTCTCHHCLVVVSGGEKAMGVNPDRKSGVEPLRRSVEPRDTFRQLLQPRLHRLYWLAFPSDPVGNAERGILATGQSRISISPAQACTWRGHFSVAVTATKPTRETAVTSYKSRAYWRKLGRYGSSPSVGGTIASHWSTTARLKLGSPQPNRC